MHKIDLNKDSYFYSVGKCPICSTYMAFQVKKPDKTIFSCRDCNCSTPLVKKGKLRLELFGFYENPSDAVKASENLCNQN